ncbi:unnamed protein product [Amoebophrya sp. A25]|nr:unnamed protein product [Amoebophrya sp. A25]|eukprot:GSA25T00011378001.1
MEGAAAAADAQGEKPAEEVSEMDKSTRTGHMLVQEISAKELQGEIDRLGFGCFQLLQVLLCGGIMFAEGSEMLVMGSITTLLHGHWELSPFLRGAMVSVVFVGFCLGNLLSGFLGDNYGRRCAILIAYVLIGVFGIATAYALNVWMMLCLRFMVGVGCGVGFPAVYTMIPEGSPLAVRSACNILMIGIMPLGELFAAIGVLMIDPWLNTSQKHCDILGAERGTSAARLFFLQTDETGNDTTFSKPTSWNGLESLQHANLLHDYTSARYNAKSSLRKRNSRTLFRTATTIAASLNPLSLMQIRSSGLISPSQKYTDSSCVMALGRSPTKPLESRDEGSARFVRPHKKSVLSKRRQLRFRYEGDNDAQARENTLVPLEPKALHKRSKSWIDSSDNASDNEMRQDCEQTTAAEFGHGFYNLFFAANNCSWRMLCEYSAVPAFLFLALAYFFLEESPHYLRSKGKYSELQKTLTILALRNGTQITPEVQERLTQLAAEEERRRSLAATATALNAGQPLKAQVSNLEKTETMSSSKESWDVQLHRLYEALTSDALFGTTLFLMVCHFTKDFSVFGLSYVFPQFFAAVQVGMISTAAELAVMSVLGLPGILAAFYLANHTTLGHRTSLQIFAAASAVACFGMMDWLLEALNVVCAYLLKCSALGFFLICVVITAETFPIDIRNSAVGLCTAVGRAGSISAPVVFELTFSSGGTEKSFNGFVSIVGVLMLFIACSVHTFLRRETKGALILDDGDEDSAPDLESASLQGNSS